MKKLLYFKVRKIDRRYDMKRRVDGLSFKAGPTQSGVTQPRGGEIVDGNVLLTLLSQYLLLIVILLIPLALAIYKKRILLPKWFTRLTYLLRGL
ncbi:MAG: hypothetical protein QXL67_02400 [Candidatus Bathyarchaeia archaeon]